MTLANIEEAVAAAQKVLGKPLPWKEYQKLLKPLEGARASFAAGDARKALGALDDFDPKGVEALKTQAETLRAEIMAAGEKRLEEAKGLIAQGEKPKERWRATYGEGYWSLYSDFEPTQHFETYDTFDDARWSVGNYFRTESEARAAVEKMKKVLLGSE